MATLPAPLTGTRLLNSLTEPPHYDDDQAVPTSPCPAWCDSDHRAELAADGGLAQARTHVSAFHFLPIKEGDGGTTSTGTRPACVSLHLEQPDNAREPRLVIRENSRRAGAQYDADGTLHGCPTWLTPHEATRLARALVALVDVSAEGATA